MIIAGNILYAKPTGCPYFSLALMAYATIVDGIPTFQYPLVFLSVHGQHSPLVFTHSHFLAFNIFVLASSPKLNPRMQYSSSSLISA